MESFIFEFIFNFIDGIMYFDVFLEYGFLREDEGRYNIRGL